MIIGLSGCSNTASYLRSQPVIFFPNTPTNIKTPLGLDITLNCITPEESTSKTSPPNQCRYLSTDLSQLPADFNSDTSSHKVISFLLSISDFNCSNFLNRAFANKAGMDFSKNMLSNLATGVSAGTVFVNPSLSAILNVSNLVATSGVESFNATYYYDKTFQAMETAIISERLDIRTYIMAKKTFHIKIIQ